MTILESKEKDMRSRFAILFAVCVIAGVLAVPALATTWYSGTLPAHTDADGPYNYWYADDTTKDYGLEHLGFEHTDGTSASISGTATYLYADTSELGFSGYIRPFVANNTSSGLANLATVCTC